MILLERDRISPRELMSRHVVLIEEVGELLQVTTAVRSPVRVPTFANDSGGLVKDRRVYLPHHAVSQGDFERAQGGDFHAYGLTRPKPVGVSDRGFREGSKRLTQGCGRSSRAAIELPEGCRQTSRARSPNLAAH